MHLSFILGGKSVGKDHTYKGGNEYCWECIAWNPMRLQERKGSCGRGFCGPPTSREMQGPAPGFVYGLRPLVPLVGHCCEANLWSMAVVPNSSQYSEPWNIVQRPESSAVVESPTRSQSVRVSGRAMHWCLLFLAYVCPLLQKLLVQL